MSIKCLSAITQEEWNIIANILSEHSELKPLDKIVPKTKPPEYFKSVGKNDDLSITWLNPGPYEYSFFK